MLRITAACSLLAFLPSCLFGGKAAPSPYYETSGIRIFKTTQDRTLKKGAYVFGGLRIEGQPVKNVDPRFTLVMDYGRDLNQNGQLESSEILDTDRINDGSLPFTYRVEELTIQPGAGQAINRIRIEFSGKDPFTFERREPGAVTSGGN